MKDLLNAKATKVKASLPFGLGEMEFEVDDSERRAAWVLYVELSTRIASQELKDDEGLLREALNSLYNAFQEARKILREAGPDIAKGPQSLGAVGVEVLNKGLRPFMAKWHPLLEEYEASRPQGMSKSAYERAWPQAAAMRDALRKLQKDMQLYVDALARIAGAR